MYNKFFCNESLLEYVISFNLDRVNMDMFIHSTHDQRLHRDTNVKKNVWH